MAQELIYRYLDRYYLPTTNSKAVFFFQVGLLIYLPIASKVRGERMNLLDLKEGQSKSNRTYCSKNVISKYENLINYNLEVLRLCKKNLKTEKRNGS